MMLVDTTSLQPARLIPTSGIGGAEEQERRATSALLAVLSAVREFGRAFTKRAGAPAGSIATFVEVPFEIDGKLVRPDGLITVRRGRSEWSALVEVKTNSNNLERPQIETYLEVARDYGIDAVITISNEVPGARGEHPVPVDRRKIGRKTLEHLSWIEIITDAVMEHDHRGISDPDQAWILAELIAYLEHPRSGALVGIDMGQHWTTVRDAARQGTLRDSDSQVDNVIRRWDELVYYLCLEFGRELGANVQRVLSRRERDDPAGRRKTAATKLARTGELEGTIRIPDAAGDIRMVGNLATRQVRAGIVINAPGTGQPKTKLNWLLRQISDAPDSVRVDVRFVGRSGTTSELLSTARARPDSVLLERTEPRAFELVLTRDMGQRRGDGAGSFGQSVSAVAHEFYQSVAQPIRAWAPSAPKLASQSQPAAKAPETPHSRLASWLEKVSEGQMAAAEPPSS